jgi:enterochelin esterase-like enzyme
MQSFTKENTIAHIKRILQRKKEGRVKIVGEVIYHRDFYSKFLNNKRDIIIWLPPSYHKSEKSYQLLIMHDGQNIMDPATSFAGVDWRVDETATRLIKTHKIEEFIVVGVNNTPDRLEEYSNSEKGKNYMLFLKDELIPYIDNNFRTLKGAENRGVMGSSLGGLISFLLCWNYPEVFGKGACLSSSFYFNNNLALQIAEGYQGEKKPVKLYIDHGEDGLIEGQKMFALLSNKGFIVGKDIDYFYAPGAQHNEKEWANRLERPLKFLFGIK